MIGPILSAFAAGFAIGLCFADAIARQRIKSWAVVRELMENKNA